MLNKIRNWIQRKKDQKMLEAFTALDRPRYWIGGYWGDKIQWSGEFQKRVVGWKCSRPSEGDWFLVGRSASIVSVFQFSKVVYCGDPSDMFFADVDYCLDVPRSIADAKYIRPGIRLYS